MALRIRERHIWNYEQKRQRDANAFYIEWQKLQGREEFALLLSKTEDFLRMYPEKRAECANEIHSLNQTIAAAPEFDDLRDIMNTRDEALIVQKMTDFESHHKDIFGLHIVAIQLKEAALVTRPGVMRICERFEFYCRNQATETANRTCKSLRALGSFVSPLVHARLDELRKQYPDCDVPEYVDLLLARISHLDKESLLYCPKNELLRIECLKNVDEIRALTADPDKLRQADKWERKIRQWK